MKQEFPWKTFKGGGQDQVRGPFRIARSPLLKEKMWIYLGPTGGTLHISNIEEIYSSGVRQAVIPISFRHLEKAMKSARSLRKRKKRA